MKTGLAISALVHAALLLWGLLSFAARPLEAKPNDALPVDIISDKQFSEITQGVKNAPKYNPLAPLVEKIGDPKRVDDSSAKVTEKKELNAAKAEPPPPAEQQPPAPAETKLDKKEPPKIDPIAETLKKEDAKKKAEEKAKAKAAIQPPAKPQPQFDPTKIAALLDKREPQRLAATGEALSPTPSLGKSDGRSAQLSQSEIDALRKRLGECWNPPAGATDGGQIKVIMRVLFKPDATVATPPQLVAGSASPFGPAMAESAKRAILTCQPFTMLRPEHYEQWKDIEITFDPREMFGG
jgi:colicin import membrane protein